MIVSCGEALVDLVPDPVPGGGPMNVSIAVARLGIPAAFVGSISTDANGQRIMAHLSGNGVDTSACHRSSAPTARAIVEHTPDLVFRFEGIDTADTKLASVDLSAIGPGPHVLHGGTLGMFRGRTAETLARLVEGHTGLVSLDPNVRPQIIEDRDGWLHYHDRWAARADIYKGSDEDLSWIWPGRTPESCAEQLLASGATAVIVTRGANGLAVFSAQGVASVGAPPVAVVDTVGAGDTIVAAVLGSLWEREVRSSRAELADIDHAGWTEIAGRAAAAAAITCSRPGADPPHRHELTW